MCRYKNMDEGTVIIYKMCSWNNLKLEGWSMDAPVEDSGMQPTQLRLIAGETKIRVALKRRIADCSVVHTRVSVHLGDIVWILSQSQLRAASKLVQSLMEAAVASAKRTREEAESASQASDSPCPSPDLSEQRRRGSSTRPNPAATQTKSPGKAHLKPPRSPTGSRKPSSKGKLTMKEMMYQNTLREYQDGKKNLPPYEVVQDSFHLRTGKVHLQFCDDMNVGKDGVNVEGSLKMLLCDLLVDVYFDQQAGAGRHHFNKANDNILRNASWSRKLVTSASKIQRMDLPSASLFYLRERVIVIRCSNFSVDSLRSGKSDDKVSLLPVVRSDKETFNIPDDIHNPAFQVDITLYYYPTECGNKFLGNCMSMEIYI